MKTLAEVRQLITSTVSPLPDEQVLLSEAGGRTLAEEILAPEDMPPFDRSAMDGYVIPANDASAKFKIVGEIQAGDAEPLTLSSGECARIFTGARIPEGGGKVIMQEVARVEGDAMMPTERTDTAFIRRQREDAAAGDPLLKPGETLSAGPMALLASIGMVRPRVYGLPRVAHLATGDELVPADEVPGPAMIRDSNSPLLKQLLDQLSIPIFKQERCGDDLGTVKSFISGAVSEGADLLLLSGGASVGSYDFGPQALEESGFEILNRRMNLKPGKPLVFATRKASADQKPCHAFVLPGNPVSHFVVFQVAVRCAIDCLVGRAPFLPLVDVELKGQSHFKSDEREMWWPAVISIEEGRMVATLCRWKSSGDLHGLAQANTLVRFPAGGEIPREGEPGQCLLLENHLPLIKG